MSETSPPPSDAAPSGAQDGRVRRESAGLPALVSMRGAARARKLRAEIADYDEGGARLICRSPLAVGSAVELSFRLPKALRGPVAGLCCRACAVVAEARCCGGGFEIVLRWDRPLAAAMAAAARRHQARVGVFLGLTLAAIAWFKWDNTRFFWYDPLFYAYSVTVGVFFLSRFALWRWYRPPSSGNYEPAVTVVISVRDEEGAIARAVTACLETNYPSGKREIIVVDDGSSDGTPRILADLAARRPELRLFTLPPTGKRAAMALGVRNASGEIIVFVDSDTFLHKDALRHIVAGFEDPTLGAVSGHTDIENADKNALTGLQEVRYVLSYRLMKAAESVFGCVTCCAGCLSAYRRSYVLPILDRWLNQRFLGARVMFGDDRSLTNFILRDYRVVYNADALSTTLVPETWSVYLKQQTRWKKSWLRETLLASRFMWRKHPFAALSFYTSAFCSLFSPCVVFRAAYLAYFDPGAYLSYYAIGIIVVGLSQCLLYLLLRPNSRWLMGMLMVASQAVVLGPQTYYALLTLRRNHWGTRSG